MGWGGVVWCGEGWGGVVWCGVVRDGVGWCGVVWVGLGWCGVVWGGVGWGGVACFVIAKSVGQKRTILGRWKFQSSLEFLLLAE